MNTKRRVYYCCAIGLIIVVGLASRCVPVVPEATGDALWAMMVFCCFRFLLVKQKLLKVAAISLITTYVVEFAQLIRWPWLVQLRSTTLGHLVLGQGFQCSDLLAYTVGVAVIYMVCWKKEKEGVG